MRLLVFAALAGALLLGTNLWLSSEAVVAGEGVGTSSPEASAGGRAAEGAPDDIVREGGAAESGAPVFTVIDVNTYEVRGTTEQEVLASMRASGPKSNGADFFGLTETQFAYRYWKNETDDGCTLDQIRVDLGVTITLPRWDAPRDAPYELRRDWTRFESALRRHEDGHREIAEWGGREIYHVLANLRTPTCAAMDAAARRAAQRLREVSEQRQRRFDQQNGHGRTQGAYWPQSARAQARRR